MDIVEKNAWKEYNSPLEIYSVYQPIQDIGHDSLRKDMKYIFTTHPLLIEETIENKKDVLLDLSSKMVNMDLSIFPICFTIKKMHCLDRVYQNN